MNSAKLKCVVTGGAGFIGSNLVDFLIENDFEVVVVDNLATGREENINKQAEFIKEDILNFDKIKDIFKGADYVFHLAALPRIQPSFEDPEGHEKVNVLGTINCLMASKGVKKFVYSCSSGIYGNPKEIPTTEKAEISCLSPYALQKYAAEQYCLILGKRYNIPVVSLRYFNVFGPRSFYPENRFSAYSPVVGIFDYLKKQGKSLTITGTGEQKRDFVNVKDVALANFLAAKSDKVFESYNIGSGEALSINEIAREFNSDIEYTEERKGEAEITLADITKAKRDLGWEPAVKVKEYINKL
jgi:UDP-glucose 4-epimerase